MPLARHSAKIYFFIISLPSAPVDALGKEEIFFKKIKTLFAECLMPGTRQRHPLPSAMPRHSAKFFLFFCFWALIFLCSPFKAPETPSYNLGIFCGFFIYLVTLFRLLDFFRKIEI